MTGLIYIPTNNVWVLLFLCFLTSICDSSDFSHSEMGEVISHCGFICISLMSSDVEHFSCISWPFIFLLFIALQNNLLTDWVALLLSV